MSDTPSKTKATFTGLILIAGGLFAGIGIEGYSQGGAPAESIEIAVDGDDLQRALRDHAEAQRSAAQAQGDDEDRQAWLVERRLVEAIISFREFRRLAEAPQPSTLPVEPTVELDFPFSTTAAGLEQANASGLTVDLGGRAWHPERSLYLTHPPRFVNGQLIFTEPGGIYLIKPDAPQHHDGVVFRDVTIVGAKGIWLHGDHSYAALDVAGLTLRNCQSGLQIDGVFREGGRVKGFQAISLHNPSGKCVALSLGCNNPGGISQDYPPIEISGVYIDGVSSDVDAECHAVASFAQPIHLTGGYISDVWAGVGKAAEGIYTKSSDNIIRGVFLRAAGNGEGVIAIKGGSATSGTLIEGCWVYREPGDHATDCAVWIQTTDSVFRGLVIKGYDGLKYGDYHHASSSTGNLIEEAE